MKKIIFLLLISNLLTSGLLAQKELNELVKRLDKLYSSINSSEIDQEMNLDMMGEKLILRSKIYLKGIKFKNETIEVIYNGNNPQMKQMQNQMKMTVISDGKEAYIINMMGKQELPKSATTTHGGNYIYLRSADVISYEGKEKVGSRNAIKLTTGSKDMPMTTWIDEKTLAVIQVKGESPNGNLSVEFTDFTKQGEFEYAKVVNVTVDGYPMMKLTTRSVRLNSKIEDSVFDADLAARKRLGAE